MDKFETVDARLYREIQQQVSYLLNCYREYAPERLGDVEDWSHDIIIRIIEKLGNPNRLTPFEKEQIKTIGVRAFIDRLVRGYIRETFRREDAGKDYVVVKDFLLLAALILEKRFGAPDDALQIKANLSHDNLIQLRDGVLLYRYEDTTFRVALEEKPEREWRIVGQWQQDGDDPLIYHIKEFRGDSDKGSKSVIVALLAAPNLFRFVEGDPRSLLLNPGLRKTDRQKNVIATKSARWQLAVGLKANQPKKQDADGEWGPIKKSERTYTRKKAVVQKLFASLGKARFRHPFGIDELHAEVSPMRRTALSFDELAYSISDAEAVGGEEESHFTLDFKSLLSDKLALDILRNLGGGLSRRHLMQKYGWSLREYNLEKEKFLARIQESFADALEDGDNLKRVLNGILEFMEVYSGQVSEERNRGEKQCKANP